MKSYTSVEHHICVICGTKFSTNTVLIDKHMRNTLEPNTITGFGLCPEHEKLHKDGFVALIVADEELSSNKPKNNMFYGLHGVYRTGVVVHIRREVAKTIFNCQNPDAPFMYCEPEVISMLERLQVID